MISPLADESANLSPAKPAIKHSVHAHSESSMLVNQVSMGFVPVHNPPMPSMPANIMSDSSDSDSGSESDSESSDSEDEGCGNENAANRTDVAGGRGTRGSTQSELEEVMPAPPPFGSSSGFWDDACDILGVASNFGEHESQSPRQQDPPIDFMDTSEAPPSSSHSTEGRERNKVGRKRKLNSESSFSLRKAQKLMSRVQNVDREESLSHASPPPVGVAVSKKKVQSSLSDSEMSEEDEEEGEISSDEEERAKKSPRAVEVATTEPQQQVGSTGSLRSNQGGANSSSKPPFIKQEVVEEEQEQDEPHSLVVRFELNNIPKVPMQKPKATVEPFYHRSTSTSKVAKRRNTVDAPGERDGDEVQPRGLSRERGERNMYNSRHREDYGYV